MDIKALDIRQDLKILTMFLIVQFFGLLIATTIYNGLSLSSLQTYQTSSSPYEPVYYVTTIAFVALIIVLLLKKVHGRSILMAFEAIAVLLGAFYFFGFIIEMFISNLNLILALSAALALAILLIKRKYKGFRNIATMITCIGLGVVIGVGLPFYIVIILMFILAAYDFIMVFITKYMITMGQAAMDMNLALLVAVGEVEAVPKSEFKKSEVAKFEEHKKKLKEYPKTLDMLDKKGYLPVYGQRALGNGDMALPLITAVSAYTVFQSFLLSMFVVLGSTLGLIITFAIQFKYRRPLPAIPPLLLGILIALAFYYLLFIL
ncbi:MAG: presenilin family intramembrane aspartyl protease [Candidatus Micrarchaeia archaeon]